MANASFATGRTGTFTLTVQGTLTHEVNKPMCAIPPPGVEWGRSNARIDIGIGAESFRLVADYQLQDALPCPVAIPYYALQWWTSCGSGIIDNHPTSPQPPFSTDEWHGVWTTSVPISVTISIDVEEWGWYEETADGVSVNNRPAFLGLGSLDEGLPATRYGNAFRYRVGGSVSVSASIGPLSRSFTCPITGSAPLSAAGGGFNARGVVEGFAKSGFNVSAHLNGAPIYVDIADAQDWNLMPACASINVGAGSVSAMINGPHCQNYMIGLGGAPKSSVSIDAKCYTYDGPYQGPLQLAYTISEQTTPPMGKIIKVVSVSNGSASISDDYINFGFSAQVDSWVSGAAIWSQDFRHAWLFDPQHDDPIDYRGFIHGRKFDISGITFHDVHPLANTFSNAPLWNVPNTNPISGFMGVSVPPTANPHWSSQQTYYSQFYRYMRIRFMAPGRCRFRLTIGGKSYRVSLPSSGLHERVIDLCVQDSIIAGTSSGGSDRFPFVFPNMWLTHTDGTMWGLNQFAAASISNYVGPSGVLHIADPELVNFDDLNVDSCIPREEFWNYVHPWELQRGVQIHNRDKIVLDLPVIFRRPIMPGLWEWDVFRIFEIGDYTGVGMGIHVGALTSNVDDGFHDAGRLMGWIGGQGRIWEGPGSSTLMLDGNQPLNKLRCQAIYDQLVLEAMSGTGWNTGGGSFGTSTMHFPVTKVIRSAASGIIASSLGARSGAVATLFRFPDIQVGDPAHSDIHGVYIAGAKPYGRHGVGHFVRFAGLQNEPAISPMYSRKRHRANMGHWPESDVANTKSNTGARYSAFVQGEGIELERAYGPHQHALFPFIANLPIDVKRIDVFRTPAITCDHVWALALNASNNIATLFLSRDQGVNFSLMTTIGPATDVAITSTPAGDVFAYLISGESIIGYRYDRSGVLRESKVVITAGVSPLGISAVATQVPGGAYGVEIVYVSSNGDALKRNLARGLDV